MIRRLCLATALVTVAGCAGGDADESSASSSTAVPSTTPVSSSSAVSSSTQVSSSPPPTDTVATTTVAAEPATSSTTVPEVCTVTIEPGDSLRAIVDRIDDSAVTLEALLDENRLVESDVIHPDQELDICIGNDIDDVTGASRLPPSAEAVMAQQRQLNELFADYSLPELLVDGVSGPLTRQALCAARMGLRLTKSIDDMSEASPEEEALFAAEAFTIPDGAATGSNRWILIDKTCQVIFTGERDERIVDIFPTSTGESGFETHDVRAAAYRFDPALDNDGWHDSTNFPSAVDNPLNGNMYKPLYFNGGQAIHGANVVPPDPRSKGCARLFPWHHDRLLSWLGLDELTEITWVEGDINATVTAQGDYRPT